MDSPKPAPQSELSDSEMRERGAVLLQELLTSKLTLEKASAAGGEYRRVFGNHPQPGAILQELLERDSLAIRPRCCEIQRERAMLFDPERLWSRACARAAIYGGSLLDETLDEFLEESIHESIRDLLENDHSMARGGVVVSPTELKHHALMVELFGISPYVALRAETIYHALPFPVRRVVFDAVARGKPHAELVSSGHGSLEQIQQWISEGFEAISNAANPDYELPLMRDTFEGDSSW